MKNLNDQATIPEAKQQIMQFFEALKVFHAKYPKIIKKLSDRVGDSTNADQIELESNLSRYRLTEMTYDVAQFEVKK